MQRTPNAVFLVSVFALLTIVLGFGTASLVNAMPGELDPSFGHIGFKSGPLLDGLDYVTDILHQPDGKIVLIGNRNVKSGSAISLMRFNPNGTLDTSFDGDGIVLDENGRANDALLQADGKIVVTGRFNRVNGTFFAMIRYNANGSLDTTFNGTGKLAIDTLITGEAIASQSDGKLVAAGTFIRVGTDDFAVVRVNSNGTVDTTFDSDGIVSTAVGEPTASNGDDKASSISVQQDGKIVLGGTSPFSATGRDFALVRYNSGGSLDSGFDSDGILHFPMAVGAVEDRLESMAIDGNGRIVAGGYSVTGAGEESFALARINSNGSLDPGFSGDGKTVFKTRANTFERINDVSIRADGKIVSAGWSGFAATDFTVIRNNADGSLDTTFGSGGAAYVRVSEETDSYLTAMAIAPNGDIFGGGHAGSFQGGVFTFAKFDENGAPSAEFGTPGYVTNDFLSDPNFSYSATSTISLSDGKFLVGGNRTDASDISQGMIAKYEANGSLDRSFNNNAGFRSLPISSATSSDLSAVQVQGDGKILCVGSYVADLDIGLFIYRLNPDGQPDSQFGSGGLVTLGILSGGVTGQDVAILPDGKIVVAGGTANILTQILRPAIFKFNSNGTRDTTFGSGGMATTSFSSGDDLALSIALQPDGKMLISGASEFALGGSNGMIALARFNSGGSLDTGFGSAGKVISDVGPLVDLGADVRIQNDGKIVVGGASCEDAKCNTGKGIVFRYNSNGSPDSSFNGNGRVILQSSPGESSAISSLKLDDAGRIFAGGAMTSPSTSADTLLLRLLPDGSFDQSFGTNGISLADIGGSAQFSFDIALQGDGKMIAAGSTENGARTDFAVWRFLAEDNVTPSSSTRFDFDGDHKADVAIFRPGPGEWWLLRSSDGGNNAYQFGSSTDTVVTGDYTGDGKYDFAFWRPSTGEWFVLRSEDSTFFGFPFGTTGDIPAPGDFDGDGKTDAAVYRPSAGVWFILRSSNGQVDVVPFGSAGDKPLVGDYDNDGKDDVAIHRPADNQFWINRSTAGVLVYQFGAAGDKPFAADFTGDGTADAGFWRPSTGEWFVIRSENQTFFAFPFGANGDIPAPADYDGDGTTDATVFRPSTNTWFSNQTTNGVVITPFGAAGDQPVAGL
ncbi:MAG: hypothetical protein R2684_17045 [Pyrinomonadaceae bacterium]